MLRDRNSCSVFCLFYI